METKHNQLEKHVILLTLLFSLLISACGNNQKANMTFLDVGMSIDDVLSRFGDYDEKYPVDDDGSLYHFYYKEDNGILFKHIYVMINKEGEITSIDYSYNLTDTKKDQREKLVKFKDNWIAFLSNKHKGFEESGVNGVLEGEYMYRWDDITLFYTVLNDEKQSLTLLVTSQ